MSEHQVIAGAERGPNLPPRPRFADVYLVHQKKAREYDAGRSDSAKNRMVFNKKLDPRQHHPGLVVRGPIDGPVLLVDVVEGRSADPSAKNDPKRTPVRAWKEGKRDTLVTVAAGVASLDETTYFWVSEERYHPAFAVDSLDFEDENGQGRRLGSFAGEPDRPPSAEGIARIGQVAKALATFDPKLPAARTWKKVYDELTKKQAG